MFGGWLRTKKNVRYLDVACMAGWNWEKKHSLRLFYLEGRKRVEHSSGILDFWRVTWGTGVCPIWSADGKPKRARRCWKTCCFRIENWQCTGKYQREREYKILKNNWENILFDKLHAQGQRNHITPRWFLLSSLCRQMVG